MEICRLCRCFKTIENQDYYCFDFNVCKLTLLEGCGRFKVRDPELVICVDCLYVQSCKTKPKYISDPPGCRDFFPKAFCEEER
jgi:hypothetical protein